MWSTEYHSQSTIPPSVSTCEYVLQGHKTHHDCSHTNVFCNFTLGLLIYHVMSATLSLFSLYIRYMYLSGTSVCRVDSCVFCCFHIMLIIVQILGLLGTELNMLYLSCSLLPPQFPQEKPVVSVYPPVGHHLVDSNNGTMISSPLVSNVRKVLCFWLSLFIIARSFKVRGLSISFDKR